MRSFLGGLLFYLLIKLFLLGVGIGVGFLLHWLLPAIDLGSGVLIGVVATGLTLHFFGRLLALVDSEPEPVLSPETMQRITYLIDPAPPRRSRRRKTPPPA